MNEKNTAIRFPSDFEFHAYRDWVATNYRPNEAVVERRQVFASGTTVAVLRTFDFATNDHDALAHVAFRRHAGVIQ